MKWIIAYACLLIISLFAVPAWCDEPQNISEFDETICVHFTETDIKTVLRILMQAANLDIDFDECVQGRLTMVVDNVPINSLFNFVLGYAELDYKQDGDKIWITCHDT